MPSPIAPAATKIQTRAGRSPLVITAVIALLLILGWSWLRLARPEQPTSTIARTMPPVAPATTQTAPAAIATLSPEEQRAQQQRVFSAFEARFRGDTADGGWSAPTEKRLIDVASAPSLAQMGVPLSYNVSCTGHMCKINLSFAQRIEADAWSKLYVTGMRGFVTAVRSAVLPNTDGTTDLVIYSVRAGSESLLFDPAGTHPDPAVPPRD